MPKILTKYMDNILSFTQLVTSTAYMKVASLYGAEWSHL